jgi:hypothetical protein
MLRIERIRNDIAALSRLAATAQINRHAALQLARRWWDLQAHLEPLLREVPGAAPSWSGAVPATLSPPGKAIPSLLHDSRTDPPARLQNLVLIGVDGSQIFPDRHALTLYYLIQVGAVIFRYDGRAPGVEVREWLHYKDEELFDAQDYLIGSEVLGQERMIQEMVVLADLAAIECRSGANAVFGLTDGPLLWPYIDRGRSMGQKLRTYLEALKRVQESGCIPVGYVDRPGGRPLLDMLWASHLSREDLVEKWQDNPLPPLDDESLMLHVLAPEERTAWFTRPTPTNARHAGMGQEIWFCYQRLDNPGPERAGRPAIARIEVPAWAVDDEASLNPMHAALLHQAQALDNYPYVLARAHEEALVTTQDKAALEQSIQRELFAAGIIAEASDKARQKLLLGRK